MHRTPRVLILETLEKILIDAFFSFTGANISIGLSAKAPILYVGQDSKVSLPTGFLPHTLHLSGQGQSGAT